MPQSPLNPQSLIAHLQWRYATQKFDAGRRVPPDVWEALEEALVLTPSSFGLQPWKFFVVEDQELRRQLRAASWNQSQITDASHLVVFAIKKDLGPADVDHFVQRIAQVQRPPEAALERQRKIMTDFVNSAARGVDINGWATKQVYIALGNFLTSAALLGVDTCPMEGLQAAQYDAILGLGPLGYRTCCAAAAGYRSAEDRYASAPKVRFPIAEVIAHL